MRELKSREGYYLTQSADVAEENRVFITAIKGINVNESDWREADEAEKQAFETIAANDSNDIMRDNNRARDNGGE